MSAHNIQNYDPNVRWSFHTFEITYMMWDYSATIISKPISGNCRGFDLFETAIDNHADQLIEEQGDNPALFLKRPAEDGDGEDTLECTPDDEEIESWLKSMCISVRLIKHEPEKKGGAA